VRGTGTVVPWMLAALPALAAAQTPAPEAPSAAAVDCPTPVFGPPRYPPELAVRGTGGKVLVDLTIDACGRVLHSTVKTSSGHKKLDEAALTASRGWVLHPADRARAVDGHFEREVAFSIGATDKVVPFARLDWPDSHRRPRYVLEPDFKDFATAATARSAIQVPVEKTMQPPYAGIQSQFFRYGDQLPMEYWLFVYRAGEANLAARYRLAFEQDEPVVRVGIVCDDKPEACEKAREQLLKGLPFAKAR